MGLAALGAGPQHTDDGDVDDTVEAEREVARLTTGQRVTIAHAAPEDLAAVRAFYGRLGDTSTRYRFFNLRRTIPDDELRHVVSESHGHVTLLAWIGDLLIGIGEYIVGSDPTEAEVAFAVADDHHREGIATLLLERLAVIGHDRGLRSFSASVLADNADMGLVFRTVGLTTQSTYDEGVVATTLDLMSVASLLAAGEARAAGNDRRLWRTSS
jgi:GNAT superfamily N-acetyltransferase